MPVTSLTGSGTHKHQAALKTIQIKHIKIQQTSENFFLIIFQNVIVFITSLISLENQISKIYFSEILFYSG